MTDIRRLIAEVVGIFALTFVGISAIANGAGLVGVALAHGIILAVMISALGAVSGGHFNPAVSVGLCLGGKITPSECLQYIIAQLLGAAAAAVAVSFVFNPGALAAVNFGTPMLAPGVSFTSGVIIEAIATFFLVTAVYGTAVDSRAPKCGGLFIGLTVVACILAAGPISGASLNPARAFGPAFIGGYWQSHLAHWVGPLLGGGFAGILYTKLFEKN